MGDELLNDLWIEGLYFLTTVHTTLWYYILEHI